jgi:hypothetical protein
MDPNAVYIRAFKRVFRKPVTAQVPVRQLISDHLKKIEFMNCDKVQKWNDALYHGPR